MTASAHAGDMTSPETTTVITTVTVQAPDGHATHENADSFEVIDNILYVIDGQNRNLAVYAPGHWCSASRATR